MRMAAVRDCLRVMEHYGVDPAAGRAIDVGGTETVFLVDGTTTRTQRNPLLEVHPGLVLLDRGFNAEEFHTRADEEIDFLIPSSIAHLRESFDLVFCFDTLEHVSNPFIFCDHLMQVLKPGGHLYLSTVFSWEYHPSPEDYFRYSPTGLRQCFMDDVNSSRGTTNIIWCDWESDDRAVGVLARKGGEPVTTPPLSLQPHKRSAAEEKARAKTPMGKARRWVRRQFR